MENSTFWAIFIIVLVVGVTLGIAYTTSSMTGAAIFDIFKVKEPTTAESAANSEEQPTQGNIVTELTTSVPSGAKWYNSILSNIEYPKCEKTYDFNLEEEHGVFYLSKCEKAIYASGNRKKEVTLHDVYFDVNEKRYLAYIEYKDYLGEDLCLEESTLIGTKESGFAVEVLKVEKGLCEEKLAESALVVIPDRLDEDYCYNVEGGPKILDSAFNKKYVFIDDSVDCIKPGYQCTGEAAVR